MLKSSVINTIRNKILDVSLHSFILAYAFIKLYVLSTRIVNITEQSGDPLHTLSLTLPGASSDTKAAPHLFHW